MTIDDILSGHDRIGWDVDGTILDHDTAPVMHDYILRHPEKKHYIVTFRSSGWEKRVFHDLSRHHAFYPGREAFSGIINCPDLVFDEFWSAQRGAQSGLIVDPKVVNRYIEWKGEVCARAGITVLIDDATSHVAPGCDRYGVVHVHPDAFYGSPHNRS